MREEDLYVSAHALKGFMGSDSTFEAVEEAISELKLLRDQAEKMKNGLLEARAFAEWVECISKPGCEMYKHELKVNADRSLELIYNILDA